MESQKLKFTAFREEGYPTLYGDQEQPLWLDFALFRLTSFFLVFYIAFLAILPGFRGIRRLYVFVRWSTAFLIAYLMLFCNLMPYWEQACLDVSTPYKAGSQQSLNATVGLNLGLRGINITLRGNPIHQLNDRFDYNEQFTWTWQQLKPGFGYDAGNFQKQYYAALKRGLPYPILWIAEAFTVDYGLVRIGRYYRQAGWLANIFTLLAVPLFVLANLLFQMVIQYGSVFMLFSGLSLLVASGVQLVMRSTIPLKVSFVEAGTMQTIVMQTHYSWCHYLNLINGITCIIIGVVTMFADLRFPDEAANFFGNDVLQSYEDYFAEPMDVSSTSVSMHTENGVKLRRRKVNNLQEDLEEAVVRTGLKKKALSHRFSRLQKSTVRRVAPAPVELRTRHHHHHGEHQDNNNKPKKDKRDSQIYENFQQFDVIGEEDIADNEI